MLPQRAGRGLHKHAALLWLGTLFTILAAAMAPAAGTPADNALDHYLSGLTSLRTSFTQRVLDARGHEGDTGAGVLLVQRPGKFRWDYQPRITGDSGDSGASAAERGQLLVADGRNLWFFDRELAQVSVKPVAQALSATPVMLLSGTVAELHDTFDIVAAPAADGLEWVTVTPRATQADFSRAQLGFKSDQLVRMIVHDRLGQTVTLEFSHSARGPHLDPSEFEFHPPQGADVIGTPGS